MSDTTRELTEDEPATGLIEASKVNGTDVYNEAGEHLGSIEEIVLQKRGGKAVYAVMSFGGFLGIGERFHPLPWSKLDYDVERGGYVVDVSRDQLEKAPTYERSEIDRPFGRAHEQRFFEYYGAAPYWIGPI